MSALIRMLRLKTTGITAGIVAREVALDTASACYTPHVVEHIPGFSNVLADALSLRFAPQPKQIPDVLQGVPGTVLPERRQDYFRSVGAPPSP